MNDTPNHSLGNQSVHDLMELIRSGQPVKSVISLSASTGHEADLEQLSGIDEDDLALLGDLD